MSLEATHALIDRALMGSVDARGQLLERLRSRVVLWASSRMSSNLRDKIEPDDLAQEVLLAVHRDFGSFRGNEPRQFLAWLFTIAEHRLRDQIDHFNAKKRQPPPDRLSFSQTDPAVATMQAELLAQVAGAVASLPEDYRRTIQLLRLEERPLGEVAAELGRSENAVRILYCRALKVLREGLSDRGVFE